MIRGPHTKLVLGKNADERFIDRPFAAFQSLKVHLEVPRQELVGADPLGIAVVVIPFGKMKILHIFFRPEQAVHPTQIGKLDCWCFARLILTPSVYGDRGPSLGSSRVPFSSKVRQVTEIRSWGRGAASAAMSALFV